MACPALDFVVGQGPPHGDTQARYKWVVDGREITKVSDQNASSPITTLSISFEEIVVMFREVFHIRLVHGQRAQNVDSAGWWGKIRETALMHGVVAR